MNLHQFKLMEVGDVAFVQLPEGKSFQDVMKKYTSYATRVGYKVTTISLTACNYDKGLMFGIVKIERLS